MAGAAPIQVGDPTRYILEEGHVSFLYRPQVSAAQCAALRNSVIAASISGPQASGPSQRVHPSVG